MAAVLDDLAQLVVQRLDRVGRVDDLAQRGPERQERGEPVPGVLPRGEGGGVLLAEVGVGEGGQRDQRGVLVRGGVGGPWQGRRGAWGGVWAVSFLHLALSTGGLGEVSGVGGILKKKTTSRETRQGE